MAISINEMKKMIKLANHLDSIGLHSEADVVDQALTKMAEAQTNLMVSAIGVHPGDADKLQIHFGGGAMVDVDLKNRYIAAMPKPRIPGRDGRIQVGGEIITDCAKIKNIQTAVENYGLSMGANNSLVDDVMTVLSVTAANNGCGGAEAGTTPTRTLTPRQGGCLVTLPSNPGTTYDYQPSSDTFSVVGGQGRIGYVFRNGSQGYNTLMAEGKGTCIRRTAPTQQPATAPQIQMGESMTGTQVDGGFEGYQGAPRDPETMRMMRARQQAERAGTRRVYEGKTQREMMQGLREGQAEERADLRSDLSAARQRYR